MRRSSILAVCAITLASAVLCGPAKSQQQAPSANPSEPAAQSAMPDQQRAAPSAQKPGPAAAGAGVSGATTPSDPQKQCVKPGEFAVELRSGRNPVGAPIVLATNFLPTNQRVDIGVRSPFVEGVRYFAGIDYGDETYLFKRQDAVTHRATESDPLVQKHLLEPDQTIVTLNMGDDLAWYWSRVDLYLYTCNSPVGQSPWRVSSVSVRLSPYWFSIFVVVAEVLILYVWIAFALRKQDHTFASFLRALNPAQVSAGPDGKGSLSTFQTLAFSLAVAALITLLLLQTGALVDLSGSILTLLGISGIGATIAKGTDTQRNTLSADNRAWLLRHGWIPMAKTVVDPWSATWRDFFTTDGVFDVYRYQSFIFGLVVIGGLIAAGVNQLSTFVVPNTILGIVGLSQVVYIGGKLVTPTNISDLNAAIAGLRSDELKLKAAAVAKKQGQVTSLAEAISLIGQDTYDAYRQKARDVAAIFADATGLSPTHRSSQSSLKGAYVSKNILLFADGTGNEGGLLPDESRTNVYKLYRATRTGPESIIDPKKQLALYVPGIGTPAPRHDGRWARLKETVQQMFGFGITKKILDCYVAIIGVWEPGDRIYLFGFSRGAYTARCLAHVLELCGVPRKERNGESISLDPKSLRRVAKEAVSSVYWSGMPREGAEADKRATQFRSAYQSEVGRAAGASAYFIGIWDAVAAIGWQRFFPDWAYDRHFASDVQYARHLQSIDEGRKDFKRVPWGGSGTVKWPDRQGEPEQFDQIWFAGNHADIGGSYPENESRLSDITLAWMVEFITDKIPEAGRVVVDKSLLRLYPSADGMMHDECMVGIGGTAFHWSKAVRDVPDTAQLHETVYERLAMKSVRNYTSFGPYRPVALQKHQQAKTFFEPSSNADIHLASKNSVAKAQGSPPSGTAT